METLTVTLPFFKCPITCSLELLLNSLSAHDELRGTNHRDSLGFRSNDLYRFAPVLLKFVLSVGVEK